MPLPLGSGTLYLGNAVVGRVTELTTTHTGMTQVSPTEWTTVTTNGLSEIERRAWAAYSSYISRNTPIWSHTATGRTPTQMTNYIATTDEAIGVTTFTTINTLTFDQPLTRLYAVANGTAINGPYIGFDEDAQMAVWAAACRRDRRGQPISTPSVAEIRRRRAAKLKAGKRALRRSIDIYARMRGMDEISRFLRGQEIIIPGCAFDYRVKKTESVLQHTMYPTGGHIPYKLEIARKDTSPGQVALGRGCIYFERTPVIDQILALSMHVADADEERRLLRTANWSLYNPRDRGRIPELLRR